MCQKSQQYAPQGQKPIAQGNTLGKSITNTNAPCKGKSVNYQCFCPCRAFCCFQSVQRVCQKSKQHAPKGQISIAQGNALGKKVYRIYRPVRATLLSHR